MLHARRQTFAQSSIRTLLMTCTGQQVSPRHNGDGGIAVVKHSVLHSRQNTGTGLVAEPEMWMMLCNIRSSQPCSLNTCRVGRIVGGIGRIGRIGRIAGSIVHGVQLVSPKSGWTVGRAVKRQVA